MKFQFSQHSFGQFMNYYYFFFILFWYAFSTAPCIGVSFDTKPHLVCCFGTLSVIVCAHAIGRSVCGSISLFSTFPQDNEVQQQIIDPAVCFLFFFPLPSVPEYLCSWQSTRQGCVHGARNGANMMTVH